MITSITLNAAIDQIYEVGSLSAGSVNRVSSVHRDAGGKGMNVAKVVSCLGGSVDVGGFAGGMNGERIRQLLEERSIPSELIPIAGESRVCLTVLDKTSGQGTELLEGGPVISESEWQTMLDWLDRKSKDVNWFALSGSLPKGLKPDAYAEMIAILNKNGAKVVLDTSGEALIKGLNAKPYAIKPNEQEIADIIGKKAMSLADLIEAGNQFVESGIEHVCFTLGGEGALIMNQKGSFVIDAPNVPVVNTVGSGDAFVGGLLFGCATGEDVETAYKRAVACGSVNATYKAIGFVDQKQVEALMKEITINKI